MYISRVVLENWKNFQNVDVRLSERVFIVGPNASGKSNFLDVFRFLRDIARDGGGLQEAVRLRGGLSKIRCLSARGKKTDVGIDIYLNETPDSSPSWRYHIGLTQRGGGAVGSSRAIIRFEKVWKRDVLVLDRPDDTDKDDEQLKEYTHLEQPTSNAKFRELAVFFRLIDYQHIIPQIIRSPLAFQGAGSVEDFYGRDLFKKMNKMSKRTRESQLKKIETALKHAVPHLKNLTLETDEAGMPHLQAVYEHWRPHGARQNEEQFSDGTLRLIGLFYAMQNGQNPLLLEEPELSLHSGVIQSLAEIIHLMQKRKAGKRQVILSTHSYDLLNNNGISADEIIILNPMDSEGTTVSNASGLREIRALLDSGLSPAEAVIPSTMAPDVRQLSFYFLD